jgi:hypothetical protein
VSDILGRKDRDERRTVSGFYNHPQAEGFRRESNDQLLHLRDGTAMERGSQAVIILNDK